MELTQKFQNDKRTPLKHGKEGCGYSWIYKGNRLWATCPYCRNQVNVRKNVVKSEELLGGGPRSSLTAK
ncbi:MAG TPA: hypothetical protein VH415_05775 [Nitrososphaeraceae archaeon]